MRLMLLVAFVASPALAATPESWAAMEADMASKCLVAADLDQGRLKGQPVHFSDVSAASVVRISGRWKPAHMKNRRADLLCLYTRTTGTAEIQESARAPGA